jgi:hypothetical protein
VENAMSLMNIREQHEFPHFDSNESPSKYRIAFWENHKAIPKHKLDYYNPATNENVKFSFFELAGMIPDWCVKPTELHQHASAAKWFYDFSCGLGDNFVKLVLFKNYGHIFCNLMNSNCVRMPVWLAQAHGIHAHQFCSADIHPNSHLMLITFSVCATITLPTWNHSINQ